MSFIDQAIRRVDAIQQRHKWLAFALGVLKKFGEDRAGNLAALIAYYGFFSLFPLLLIFVSVLGLLLRNDPGLQHRILESALRDFPVIGDQIARNIHAISGSGLALAVGIAGTLWGGLGVTQAVQNAMNQIWDVPKKEWPNFLKSRVRGLAMLAILGTLTVASTFLSGLATSGVPGLLGAAAGIISSMVVNLALFLLAFRILTVRDLSWGDVFPGAGVAALLWTAMQSLGGYYVTHQIKNSSEVYGTFALVIGLLVWLYLAAQITLLAAEINVVRVNHLWPRSLVQRPPLAEADRRADEAQRSVSGPEGSSDPSDSSDSSDSSDGHRRGGGFLRSAAAGAGAVLVAGVVSRIRRRRKRED